MSKDDIHDIAAKDTPEVVTVPNSWPALVMWALGRFGAGIVVLIVVGYIMTFAIKRVYEDQVTTNQGVLRMVEAAARSTTESAAANQATARAIAELAKQVENNTKAINDAHMRVFSPR